MSGSTQPRSDPAFGVVRHPAAARVRFGDFDYDLRDRRLEQDGREVDLPPRALAVLDCLLGRRGKVVSKEVLIEQVWGGMHVADASVTEAVSLLRQALGDSAQTPSFIRTVHRRGYRFMADVRPVSLAEPMAVADPVIDPPEAQPASPESGQDASPTEPAPWARWLAVLVAASVVVHLLVLWSGRADKPASTPDASAAHFLIPWQPFGEVDRELPALALSADGRQLVWKVRRDGNSILVHRPMDQIESRILPETMGATTPFLSPDGRWVGFFADRTLWKLDLAGGSRVAICEAAYALGASWGDDGTADGSIVFSPHPGSALLRVSAAGGEPEPIAHADPSAGEVALFWPQYLPDGDLLVTAWANTVASASLVRFDPATGERTTLATSAAGGRWLPAIDPGRPGHLVFSRPDGPVAATFDLRTNELGSPQPVLADLMVEPFSGLLQLASAANGTLVYLPTGPHPEHAGGATYGERRLVRVDRQGRVTHLGTPARFYRNLEVSPDGERAAVTIAEGDESDVWIVDIEAGTLRRLTFEGFDIEPVWTPDGSAVTFASDRGGRYGVYRKQADGQGAAELLFDVPHHSYPWAWLPGGDGLIYAEARHETSWDLWLWSEGGERRPLFASDALESGAAPSPDGELVALEVATSGDWQLFLYDYPELSSRWQITDDGGWFPVWSADGGSLFFSDGDGLQEVVVRRDGRILPGPPTRLFDHRKLGLDMVQPAGDGFLAIQEKPTAQPEGLHVVLNWSP